MNYTNSVNYLKTSPLFNLSLSSKELFHSNFLYWIWKVCPNAFRQIMEDFGANTKQWPNNYMVRREYKNFDLCVLDNDKILLVLENKVKSIPNKKQLDGYQAKVQKLLGINAYPAVDFILLTLPQNFPDKNKIINEGKWKLVDYGTYYNSLKNITSSQDLRPYALILNDYINFLDALVSLYNEWDQNCYTPLFVNSISPNYVTDATDLRIHDLYHKSKYARICANLQTQINNIISNHHYSEVENDDEVIFSQNGACIAYGYGLTKGQPFVEVKVKPSNMSYIFAIQVQGKDYRHCVLKDHKGTWAPGIWNSLSPQGNVVCRGSNNNPWMRYENQQFTSPNTIIDVNLTNNSQMFKSNTPLYPANKPYLKFAGAKSKFGMIYQYRKLDDKLGTDDLIKYIVEDVNLFL